MLSETKSKRSRIYRHSRWMNVRSYHWRTSRDCINSWESSYLIIRSLDRSFLICFIFRICNPFRLVGISSSRWRTWNAWSSCRNCTYWISWITKSLRMQDTETMCLNYCQNLECSIVSMHKARKYPSTMKRKTMRKMMKMTMTITKKMRKMKKELPKRKKLFLKE